MSASQHLRSQEEGMQPADPGIPDPKKQFILDTDASQMAIGSILSRVDNGQEKVIACFSWTLTRPEQNCYANQKQLLAVVKSIKHFYKYLYGQQFVLRTDHSVLQYLLNFKDTVEQVARWIRQLQEYDFQIQHRKGTSHQNTDGLSQIPYDLECKQCQHIKKNDVVHIQKLIQTQPAEWRQEQSNDDNDDDDDDISPILRAKEQNAQPGQADVSDQSREDLVGSMGLPTH